MNFRRTIIFIFVVGGAFFSGITGCRSLDKKVVQMSALQLVSQEPTFTLKVAFVGQDSHSLYLDEWTNYYACDALASMDISQPLAQWDKFPDVALTNFNGTLGFEIITNTPWLFVTAQYREK